MLQHSNNIITSHFIHRTHQTDELPRVELDVHLFQIDLADLLFFTSSNLQEHTAVTLEPIFMLVINDIKVAILGNLHSIGDLQWASKLLNQDIEENLQTEQCQYSVYILS